MAEKVELVNGFAVQIQGDAEPVFVTRDNLDALWGRMSDEQKTHHRKRNVRVIEQSAEAEAYDREQQRDRTLDEPGAQTDAATGQPAKRKRGGD